MKPPGPISRAWFKWKSLNLPWRKRFLVGSDLEGNTYWIFRLTNDPTSSTRWRRIVEYPRSAHLSSVKVGPLWHQWLRYARDEAPSLDEQRADVARRLRTRALAAEADARWEAKPRLAGDDVPGRGEKGQPVPVLEGAAERGREKARHEDEGSGGGGDVRAEAEKGVGKEEKDPWAKHRSTGPGEQWQPGGWTPTSTRK